MLSEIEKNEATAALVQSVYGANSEMEFRLQSRNWGESFLWRRFVELSASG